MAEYRTVQTRVWRDEWFSELPPDGKLLFLYLVTNEAASVAGIYLLPVKFMAFDTGLTIARVTELLDEFERAGKIQRADAVIWVRKLRDYQETRSPKVQTRIAKDVALIPDGPLKRAYQIRYGPNGRSVDTVSIPYLESESDTDTDTDTDTEGGHGADAPAPRNPAPASDVPVPTEHPAVVVFRELTGRWPAKLPRDSIRNRVSYLPDDLAFWREVVSAWIMAGWNKSNVAGMLECYGRHEVPGTNRRPKPGETPFVPTSVYE